jgi:hypothetical protein
MSRRRGCEGYRIYALDIAVELTHLNIEGGDQSNEQPE